MKKIIISLLAIMFILDTSAQNKTYKIGDYYNDGKGISGYVFEVSDNGEHGKIVGIPIRRGTSLLSVGYERLVNHGVPELRCQDGNPMSLTLPLRLLWVNATSESDGMENTKKLYKGWCDLRTKYKFDLSSLSEIPYALSDKRGATDGADYSNDADMFNGWYLPAIDELTSFYGAVAQDNLNQLIKNDILNTNHIGNVGSDREQYWKNFMKIPMGFFWSSTQLPNKDYSRWLVLDLRDGQCYGFDVDPDYRYWYILIHKF